MERKHDFDGVYIIPIRGTSPVDSRDKPSMISDFWGIHPIMSSPMKWLGTPKFVKEMAKNNCFGFLHRFDTNENRISAIDEVSKETNLFGIAIGINDFDNEFEVAKRAIDAGARIICVDVANGYMSKLRAVVAILREATKNSTCEVMAGNVITLPGAEDLVRSGCSFVRLGVGNGGNCQTRTVTRIGRNQLAVLKDCLSLDGYVVSDGGIRNSGDMSLAFACGADFVMLASALAHAEELEHDGILYGMASARIHAEVGKQVKTIEGFETKVTKEKQPLKDIINELLYGVKSTCTYLGANSYQEIPLKSYLVPEKEDWIYG